MNNTNYQFKGQEATIVVPSLVEEELMTKFSIESPSSQAVNRIEQDSNEEKVNDPNQECTKHFNKIEPQVLLISHLLFFKLR